MNKKGIWALAILISLVAISAITSISAARGGRGGGGRGGRGGAGRHHGGGSWRGHRGYYGRGRGYRRGGVAIGFGIGAPYAYRYPYATWSTSDYPGELSECTSDLRGCYKQNQALRDKIDDLQEQIAELQTTKSSYPPAA